jgi:hypothetical protein
MAQITSFSVDDRESTPVSHTFSPAGFAQGNSVALFREAADTPHGDIKFSVGWRSTGANRKVRVKLEVPVVVTETINGVDKPEVIRKSYVDCVFTFDQYSTQQERDNAVGMFANALDSSITVIDDTVAGTDPIY